MNTVNTASILDRARNIFQLGYAKECLLILQNSFMELEVDDVNKFRFRNDIILLLSNLNQLEFERIRTSSEEYKVQSNKLNAAVLDLLISIEHSVSSQNPLPKINGKKYRVELAFDLDFKKTTDEEIEEFVAKIVAIIKTNPDELIIQNKRPGSIIVELELTAEEIVKIKSLAKIGLFKELKDIKGLVETWDWIENNQVFFLYLNRANLIGMNLNRADLSEADLSEANLSEANLSRADLSEADLSEANLSEANLSRADLSRANLSKADLSKADLSRADLSRASLSNAKLVLTILTDAYLSGAYLSGADLSGANLRGTIFIRTDLSGADLRRADFRRADLRRADLRRADLRRADLRGAKLVLTNLCANLSEANLSRVYLREADLREADLSRADLSGADLMGANLSELNLREANLSGANLKKADLSEADLSGADLSGADLSGANLSGANFINAKLRKAILNGTKFTKVIFHISQAEFLRSKRIDISEVIFVDDDNTRVPGWLFVE